MFRGLALMGCAAFVGCAHLPRASRAVSATANPDQLVAEVLSTRLDSLRVASRIPGLAVVVLRDTTIILARGFGYSDVESKVPVTPDTPFDIASVTKAISAVVALRLVERGVLDLDKPMHSYDGYSDYCKAVREAGGIFFADYECERYPISLRNVLSMEVNGQPGTRFFYNPPAYSWASRPMAQVSGIGFSELTAREIFVPSGMIDSRRKHRRLPLAPDMVARLAKPYHVDSTGKVVPSDSPPPQGDGAAGGVIATAHDLARFDIALTQGRLLSPESRKAMWTPGRSLAGAVLPYGLGWFVQEFEGEQLLWHTGLWEGMYSALYIKVPARQLTMILLANSDGLQWVTALDEAVAERSPFVMALLGTLPR